MRLDHVDRFVISDESFREDVEMTNADGSEPQDDDETEEEVPMIHLASFAIHKLFSEWQSEGFSIPDFKIGSQPPPAGNGQQQAQIPDDRSSVSQSPPQGKSKLPPNPTFIHPTSLLCMVSQPREQ